MIKKFENFLTEQLIPSSQKQDIIYILQDITDDGWEIVKQSYGGPGNRIEVKSPPFKIQNIKPGKKPPMTEEYYKVTSNEIQSIIEEVIQSIETVMLRINEIREIKKCDLSISCSVPNFHSNNRTFIFRVVNNEVQRFLDWNMEKFVRECISSRLHILTFRFYIFTV